MSRLRAKSDAGLGNLSGNYAWLRGGERPENGQSGPARGTGAPAKIPCPGAGQPVPHAPARLSLFEGEGCTGLRPPASTPQRKRAYKATTNSRHNCPIAPNLLQRQFTFSRPNQAWVGDITYIPTGEGWLYFAIVKDLCTKKIVGYAFSQRIDTQLTLDALNMAVRRERPAPGLIFQRPGASVRRRGLPRASGFPGRPACPARATPGRKTFSAA